MATSNSSGFSSGSIKESMSRKLSEYHAITKELIDSILLSYNPKTPNVNLPEPHIVMQKLLDKDKEFQKLLEELEEHQKFQQKIHDISKQIEEKDKVIQDMAFQLRKAETMLQEIVDDAKSKLAVIEKSNQAPIDPQEIVSYAHKISYSTAGPPGWSLGNPLGMFRPPAPQEDEMRSGVLVAASNIKIPKT